MRGMHLIRTIARQKVSFEFISSILNRANTSLYLAMAEDAAVIPASAGLGDHPELTAPASDAPPTAVTAPALVSTSSSVIVSANFLCVHRAKTIPLPKAKTAPKDR